MTKHIHVPGDYEITIKKQQSSSTYEAPPRIGEYVTILVVICMFFPRFAKMLVSGTITLLGWALVIWVAYKILKRLERKSKQ